MVGCWEELDHRIGKGKWCGCLAGTGPKPTLIETTPNLWVVEERKILVLYCISVLLTLVRGYHISFQPCLAEAANDIGPKLTYSSAACRVAMGTYPASKPGGGVTIKAGSISASFPIVGGAR